MYLVKKNIIDKKARAKIKIVIINKNEKLIELLCYTHILDIPEISFLCEKSRE